MKKVTYILSFVDKSLAFEWIIEKINQNKYELSFILLNDKEPYLFHWLKERGIECFFIPHIGKKSYPISIYKTFSLLKKIKPEIIHTHLFDACIIGLIAGKLSGIKKRIHTRHNATIHHDYFPKAVKYDKFINFLSTDIIAISENVKNILIDMEGADEKKIHLIPHGFNLQEFENVSDERIETLNQKYTLTQNNKPIIGVISRYIHWKGIQFIIPAFIEFHKNFPEAHFIFANASGPFDAEIKKLLNQLPNKSYTEIKFEQDIAALYKLFDCFVHAPIDEKSEAYGQIYVEAMAAEIPCIVTKSGIANEYIEDKKNAIVVPFKDADSIYKALNLLFSDNKLKNKLIHNAKNDVKERFGIEKMIQKLEELYGK